MVVNIAMVIHMLVSEYLTAISIKTTYYRHQ